MIRMRRRRVGAFGAGLAVGLAAIGVAEAEQPKPPPAGTFREVEARDGYRVRLDLSKAVLAVDIPEDRGYADRPGRVEPPLGPTPDTGGGFVSASALGWKAKQFDDGLYAAVELAAQNGTGSFAGKARLLEVLARAFDGREAAALGNAPGVVLGAARLGGVAVPVPPALAPGVESLTASFLANPLRSKPLGFYTWSEPLGAIFRQDRMLQTPLEGRGGIEALATTLRSDPQARASYERYLRLTERLTNPLVAADLRGVLRTYDAGRPEVPDRDVAVFPPSRSHEAELVKKLYGNQPIPEGFDLATELIRRIRAGSISLEPAADSGWYDRQTWALEPLVRPEATPEAPRLQLSESYRKQLEELFRGLLTLTRETHVKQLEIPAPGAMAPPPILIAPEISAEPLATHYQRRAEAYAFVRGVLEEAFGTEGLRTLHRQTAAGPVAIDLATELRQMESLCAGAAIAVGRELGVELPARAGQDVAADVKVFQDWKAKLASDPDLGGDARVMVPVFYDRGRNLTKVWAVLGWAVRPVRFEYATPPPATITRNGQPVDPKDVEMVFEDTHRPIAYPVTAEVYVKTPLDRAEFRALCDRYKTRTAILQHLQ